MGTFEITHKISSPYIERYNFYTMLKIYELPDLWPGMHFLNAPQIMEHPYWLSMQSGAGCNHFGHSLTGCGSYHIHYNDVIMSTMASKIISLTIVYSTIYSGTDERKHQSSASLAFVGGVHQLLVNSLHKGPVTRKMFPFDDIIMP